MVDIKTVLHKNQNTPNLDIEILLAHTLHRSREFLHTHPEYKLTLLERLRLAYFLWLYKRGYSVAAITHHKEFYGLDFWVNKHTLIPRPETELIVEGVLETIKNQELRIKNYGVTLIDVGTGSGCIPIAIKKTLKHENIKTLATDISSPALRVARRNAREHKVEINFLRGNLLEPLVRKSSFFNLHSSFVITANLPYLTQTQFDNEPSIQKEPHSALVAGNDGLALYEELLQQIKSLFFNLKSSIFIFLEIDPSQSSKITSLIKQHLPATSVEIKTDLAGRDRVVKIDLGRVD
jgi:release factor glutamine methyltransferase